MKKPMPAEKPHWSELLRALKVKECFPVPPENRADVQSIAYRIARDEDKKFTIRTIVDEQSGEAEIYCWRTK